MSQELRLYQQAEINNVLQKDQDGDSTVIVEGYASFYRHDSGMLQVDRDGEIVNTDMLDIESYKKNPVLLYNHDWGDVVGKIVSVTKDIRGIKVTAEVNRLTGRESVYENVKLGNIKSFSIGFIPQDYEFYDDGVVEISQANLVEISLAPVQSNPEALFGVIGTKSMGVKASKFAEQNNLSEDEMNTLLKRSNKKGDNMETKSPEEVAEQAKIKAEQEAKLKAEADAKAQLEQEAKLQAEKEKAEADAKAKLQAEKEKEKAEADAKPANVDLATLVTALAESQLKADELKAAKEQADATAKAEAEKEDKAKVEARITDALAYIREQKDLIANTPAKEIDVDELDAFYDAVSDATETIEAKVIELTEAMKAEPAS